MLSNSTKNNLYNTDSMCRDFRSCTENKTTVLAVYDICEDTLVGYPSLSNQFKQEEKSRAAIKGQSEM